VKGLDPSRNGTYEKFKTSYCIEELMFARLELPAAVLLKLRIF
jgi:hypothetical protein